MQSRKNSYDFLKRGIDIVGSGVGLVVLSPVIGAVSLAVRSKLGAPVIFKQRRPGKGGKIFTLYKFRTMLDVDETKGLVSNEDRMTSFGRKLRSTSLDELPSLMNVLKGEMSLVGPRPLLVDYLDRYSPEQFRRHETRPGITGLAQVNGRNDLNWNDRFTLDVEYVDNRSLMLDFGIILKTMVTALRRDGVTSDGHVVGSHFNGDDSTSKNAQEHLSVVRGDMANA